MKKMDKNFWIKVAIKLVETVTSIKVWVIAALLITSTKLLLMGLLTELPGCRKMTSPSATKSDKEQPSPDTDTSRRSHADGDTGILVP